MRKVIFANDQFYHLYNRGVNKAVIFESEADYIRCLDEIHYYSFTGQTFKFSHLNLVSQEKRNQALFTLRELPRLVEIHALILMPNHFHLLVRQKVDDGIRRFVANFQNGYAKYFNTKYERVGPFFQGRFKSVLVESEEQLLHVARYIHLNPYSGQVVSSLEALARYPWSSLPAFLEGNEQANYHFSLLTDYFPDKEHFKRFVFDHADHQRSLGLIKDQALD